MLCICFLRIPQPIITSVVEQKFIPPGYKELKCKIKAQLGLDLPGQELWSSLASGLPASHGVP